MIIVKYISINYLDGMRVPRPMPEHKFDNEYDVIIFALSTILDPLERKDQFFAAQCVCWLASMIQYTDILLFYRRFKIFPSYYVKNCTVSPLPETNKKVRPEQDISESELAEDINEKLERSRLWRPSGKVVTSTQRILGSTQSGRVFKPQKIKQWALAARYARKSQKQLQEIRNSLRTDGLIL